jgi:hypothetical protein
VGAVSLKDRKIRQVWMIDGHGGYFDADSVFQDKRTFVSKAGVPFAKRTLPEKTLSSHYNSYKISKPIVGYRKGKLFHGLPNQV